MLARFPHLLGFTALVTLLASCDRDVPVGPIQADVMEADSMPPDTLAPPNDNIANARFAFPLPYDDTADLFHATIEPGEPSSTCDAVAGPVSRSVWYFTTSQLSAPMTAQLLGDTMGVVAVYAVSFDSTGQVLTEVGCSVLFNPVTFFADSGTSFYFQVYDYQDVGAQPLFHLEQQGSGTGPANDNFANAELAPGVPFSATADFNAATREFGEPSLCGFQSQTVWYAFTPTQTGTVVASMQSPFFNFIAVYTGTSLSNLSTVSCGHSFNSPAFTAVAGTTYFIQLSADFDHTATFQLLPPPPPQANFGAFPFDPSIFDNVQFVDFSFDPAGIGIQSRQWDFGDGTTGTGFFVLHRYAADGEYQVTLTVRTFDGRTGSITRPIQVRTRDVAITRFATPSSGMTGKTTKITVDIRSNRYPETVQVQLFKSVPGGFQLVATSIQTLPVRNRTTSVAFSYTFAPEDAIIGKVTFKAVVFVLGGRDALPADNEAIGSPTKVSR